MCVFDVNVVILIIFNLIAPSKSSTPTAVTTSPPVPLTTENKLSAPLIVNVPTQPTTIVSLVKTNKKEVRARSSQMKW